jgi:hypothetical protein
MIDMMTCFFQVAAARIAKPRLGISYPQDVMM